MQTENDHARSHPRNQEPQGRPCEKAPAPLNQWRQPDIHPKQTLLRVLCRSASCLRVLSLRLASKPSLAFLQELRHFCAQTPCALERLPLLGQRGVRPSSFHLEYLSNFMWVSKWGLPKCLVSFRAPFPKNEPRCYLQQHGLQRNQTTLNPSEPSATNAPCHLETFRNFPEPYLGAAPDRSGATLIACGWGKSYPR